MCAEGRAGDDCSLAAGADCPGWPDAMCSGTAHGVCVEGRCRCTAGWTGPACKERILPPVACPNACSGHGACSRRGRCSCDDGYAGDACDRKESWGQALLVALRRWFWLWVLLATCVLALAITCARSTALRARMRRALPERWRGTILEQGWVMKEASGQIPGARYERWQG